MLRIKKGIAVFLVLWMVLTAGICTSALAQPRLANLKLKSVDSSTIRATWEGNDPPYQVTCYAPAGSSHRGWKDEDNYIQVKTTSEETASFGYQDFGFNNWLFPNTEYTISVQSASGLVLEKNVRTLKPQTYNRFNGKARLHLMDTDYATYDDIDEARANKNPVSYFSDRTVKQKLSLEMARTHDFYFRPWFTIKYQNASKDHKFCVRLLLRAPTGQVVNAIYTIPQIYSFPAASRNWTWYSILENTADQGEAQLTRIPKEAFTTTGKYIFEMYFDEYLAATQTLTIY